MSTSENHDGWDLHTSGPAAADHTVLLVPGAKAALTTVFRPQSG